MNDILVIVDGIIQSTPMYTIKNEEQLVFREAPVMGSNITIRVRNKALSYHGNGTNVVFSFPEEIIEEIRFQEFFKNVLIHKDNPAVKDQLEKLKAIVELLR